MIVFVGAIELEYQYTTSSISIQSMTSEIMLFFFRACRQNARGYGPWNQFLTTGHDGRSYTQ